MIRSFIKHGDRRRQSGIVQAVQSMLPDGPVSILDVGCGNGIIATQLKQRQPEISIQGIDVVMPADCGIPVSLYDGHSIPFKDAAFDVVLCIDMLHHSTEPKRILKEAVRVARHWVIIKDHLAESWWDRQLLTFLDWVGNIGSGVPMPYNFLSRFQWQTLFTELELIEVTRQDRFRYWFWPVSVVIDRHIHFAVKLSRS